MKMNVVNEDKNTYISCNVSLKDKTITVITEVDLNSEIANEYLTTVTLDKIKDNYAESTYKCEQKVFMFNFRKRTYNIMYATRVI